MILKMVLGLMQSILSFILGLLPLPDVPAWLVELTETILGYMKTGMGIVLFFVPQAVVQGALDLVILVWTVVHGYKLVMWVLRKIPMLGIDFSSLQSSSCIACSTISVSFLSGHSSLSFSSASKVLSLSLYVFGVFICPLLSFCLYYITSLTISRNGMRPTLNTLSCRSVTKMAHGIFTALFRGFRPVSLFALKLLHGATLKRIR